MFSLPSCLIRFYLILTVPIHISSKSVSEIDYNVYPECMQQECRQISEALPDIRRLSEIAESLQQLRRIISPFFASFKGFGINFPLLCLIDEYDQHDHKDDIKQRQRERDDRQIIVDCKKLRA